MSQNRYLTQEILSSDCLGDSLAKHNYNLLSLDTNICNLSSLFFDGDQSYYNIFSDFKQNSAAFVNFLNLLNVDRFNTVYTAVNILSSYWESHEFSVYYPFNIYTDDGTPDNHLSVNQTDQNLLSLAYTHLENNYPAYSFPEGTIVNVIFFLYNVPLNPNDPNDLITSDVSPYFSYTIRSMYAKYKKQDVFYQKGKIFKFYKKNNIWNSISSETGSSEENSADLTQLKQTQQERILVKPPNGRSTINLTINSNTYNYDIFYNAVKTGLYYTGFTDVVLTIEQGNIVGSKNRLNPSILVSDLFADGDTILIVNYGNIYGAGGDGGNGQNVGEQLNDSVNGRDGGDAIKIQHPTSILNYGTIAGGGGGGAGQKATYSDSSYLQLNKTETVKAGDGGGGGAGYNPGSGGIGGYDYENLLNPQIKYNFTLVNGTNGGNANNTDGAYSNTAGSGGALGRKGADTGFISNGKQLAPYGGLAGNYINGYSLAIFKLKGTLLGNYR
jgi:hypothetical protein